MIQQRQIRDVKPGKPSALYQQWSCQLLTSLTQMISRIWLRLISATDYGLVYKTVDDAAPAGINVCSNRCGKLWVTIDRLTLTSRDQVPIRLSLGSPHKQRNVCDELCAQLRLLYIIFPQAAAFDILLLRFSALFLAASWSSSRFASIFEVESISAATDTDDPQISTEIVHIINDGYIVANAPPPPPVSSSKSATPVM